MIDSIIGLDAVAFFGCMLLLIASAFISVKRKGTASGYFMADRNLRWWSVAGSIYGTNVSLAQIIGMLGIGYSIGFAQSHYELLAIPAIFILVHVFIPVYRKKQVFTLSEFLGNRYNETARVLYTIIILAVILILLVGGLYIGSRQLGLLLNGTLLKPNYLQGILFIALIACLLIFYGGMHAVVFAENIITILMVVAVITVGVCTLYQPEIGGFSGLMQLDASAKGMNKMHLYLPSDHPDLPWTGVFSGLLVLHGFFWTTNQFEVQRVLAAKSDRDAQLGAIAAGFLKLTIPFFSISAGVAAAYLFKYKYNMDFVKPDDAFMYLLQQVVPKGYGLVGLILAGFIGAIFSSIYSMLNSLSTITAMDLYKRYRNQNADDKQLVKVGKMAVVTACFLSVIFAWWSFDPTSDGNFFLVLSKNTSYLKPGIVSAFFLGVLWKKTHPDSAAVAIVAAPLLSFILEWTYDEKLSSLLFWRTHFGIKLNFLHRVFIVFAACLTIQIAMSFRYEESKREALTHLDPVLISIYPIIQLVLIHAMMIGLITFSVITAHAVSPWAGILSFVIINEGIKPRDQVIFWSSILMAAMSWSLYQFA